jgi:hypothetical protein
MVKAKVCFFKSGPNTKIKVKYLGSTEKPYQRKTSSGRPKPALESYIQGYF